MLIFCPERVLKLDILLYVERYGFCSADNDKWVLRTVNFPEARQKFASEELIPASKAVVDVVWIWNMVCVQEVLETRARGISLCSG